MNRDTLLSSIADASNSTVQPKPPKQVNYSDIRDSELSESWDIFAGCFVSVAVFVASIAILWLTSIHEKGCFMWLIPPVVAAIAPPSLIFSLRDQRKEKLLVKKRQQATEEALNEATRLTDSLRRKFKEAFELNSRVASSHSTIWNQLQTARHEFKARAFSPYWDQVTHIVVQLSKHREILDRYRSAVSNYQISLSGREHDFPNWPIPASHIPKANELVAEFNAVVRQALTDFEFASIWESRKTQEILISGFRTLEDSVKGIGANVTRSLHELQREVELLRQRFA